jgi:hypothetical protein
MEARNIIADRLSAASATQLASAQKWLNGLTGAEHTVLLMEVCREMDYRNVLQAYAQDPEQKLAPPTLDVMYQGWNLALSLLLPFGRGVKGVPLMESTPDSRHHAMTLLQQLGRSSLLQQTAEMLRHGMVEGVADGDTISLRTSERALIDRFLDQLETAKLKEWSKRSRQDGEMGTQLDSPLLPDIDARMKRLVFPWITNRGTMVGYGAEPEIDAHFFSLVKETTLDWMNEAGLHPEAHIGTVPCGDIVAIALLLTSFNLKHLRFVELGKREHSETNYAMSLTIWKPETDVCASLADFMGMERSRVAATLDLITIRPEHHRYFANEITPFVPLLIEISDGYLLSPVSSIFRNPMHGIRMYHESRPGIAIALREPRETWMRSDLYSLFQGNRYELVQGSVRLKASGQTVTDVDAAILDRTTGDLALFQLKWQDFSSGEIRKQRSKAKNFVEQVDEWTSVVQNWLAAEGLEVLCRALRLNVKAAAPVRELRLFAIGRSAARFRSYGYASTRDDIAACTWHQFARCRLEIGIMPDVIPMLFERIQSQRSHPLHKKPLPLQMQIDGLSIVFEDMWSELDADEH